MARVTDAREKRKQVKEQRKRKETVPTQLVTNEKKRKRNENRVEVAQNYIPAEEVLVNGTELNRRDARKRKETLRAT
jgi:hypothetical protein